MSVWSVYIDGTWEATFRLEGRARTLARAVGVTRAEVREEKAEEPPPRVAGEHHAGSGV